MRESVLEAGPSVMDFEALKARCLGNLNLVERILRKFAVQLDVDVDALETAYRLGDTEAFALIAHRIKGMSANVEAHSLYESAAAAEKAARNNCLDLPEQIERILQAKEELAASLSDYTGLN